MRNTDDGARRATLSKTTVTAAKPAATRYTIWDDRLAGFGLRVEPSGVKTYVYRYRPAGGGRRAPLRQCRIGRVGDKGLTPDEAYKQADLKRAVVMTGGDPQGDLAAKRKEKTVAEFCDSYLESAVFLKKSEGRQAVDKMRIERHIKPAIGKMPLAAVRRSDVEKLMQKVWTGKIKAESTKRTRGGPTAAASTVGLLGGIFTEAMRSKEPGVTENPAHGIDRPEDKKRDRYLTNDEITRLCEVMDRLTLLRHSPERAKGKIVTKQHVQAIRLLLLTGSRKNEIVRLKWSEVNLDPGFLALGKTKTGPQKRQLGAGAITVLSEIEHTDAPWVFPDPSDPSRPINNVDWAWCCIREAAGLDDVRVHDLRHTFASISVMGGQSLALIGKLLGHARAQTTERYAHLAPDHVRAGADVVSNRIAATMRGESAEIHKIGGKR